MSKKITDIEHVGGVKSIYITITKGASREEAIVAAARVASLLLDLGAERPFEIQYDLGHITHTQTYR